MAVSGRRRPVLSQRWPWPRRLLRALCCLALGLLGCVQLRAEPAAADVRLPIGMNLTGISDYAPGFPFKNLMWGARPWLTRNADGSGPFDTAHAAALPLDLNGYPLRLPAELAGLAAPQVVHTIIPNVTEPGRYVVLYDGEGEITATLHTRLVSTAPGRLVIELDGISGDGRLKGIAITRSVQGNQVRNIRIVAERDASADLEANPFRDDFLAYCRQWHALRFMDWQVTNNSMEREWSQRKRRGFYTMVGRGGDAIGRYGPAPTPFAQLFSGGVALELIIQLANLSGTDPWVSVPHRATPEYMQQMAHLFKRSLDPQRKVYVEYSNEVWNNDFMQAKWMLQSKVAADAVIAAGGTAWQGGVEPAMPYEGGSVAKEGGVGHPERMAALARRCFAEWEAVFDPASRHRLVRVVGVQQSYTATQRRTAKWVAENGGADVMAAAGYFGPDKAVHDRWEDAGAALTADQVVQDMAGVFEKQSAEWTRQGAAVARRYGLGYVVYEGGQHIQSRLQAETPYLPALKAAQYHDGLYDISMRNLRLHQAVGCELFMAFSSIGIQGTRWGSFGHQERYGQPASEMPKYRALLDANLPR